MKSVRERMDIQSAYREVGTYRGAAEICGVTHKTVKRVVEASLRDEPDPAVAHNYDAVTDLVTERVARTKGRISAKRLLPVAVAAGYSGSARNFRRLVACEKAAFATEHHRGRRPATWAPGEHLVFDWGEIGPLYVFCAVMAWSRWRFVAFAADLGAETTMTLLAECFESLGGVPRVALTDRMGCLKGGTVAGVVIPTAAYVRFAAHYGFSPDFCEGADPESKGIVENLVGYVKSDLMIPEELVVADLASANAHGAAWCTEVNAQVHSEICAVPAERLETERQLLGPLPSLRPAIAKTVMRKVDRLSCVRFGSARYSVPNALIGADVAVAVTHGQLEVLAGGELVASHPVVAPGEVSLDDDHYGGPRPALRRAVRAKTADEKEFLSLGEVAGSFIRGAASSGVTALAGDLCELVGMRAAHGDEALIAALGRAAAFGRFRAHDVRSILAAGRGVPQPTARGEALIVSLPFVPARALSEYAIGALS
jgi:transposase